MEPRPAAESHAVLVRWMSLVDANSAGFVHGGTVMKMCDEAAGLSAIKHSRCRVVTAGMDRMTFNEPVHIGELLTFKAAVNAPASPCGLVTGFASGGPRWRSASGSRRSSRAAASSAIRARPT